VCRVVVVARRIKGGDRQVASIILRSSVLQKVWKKQVIMQSKILLCFLVVLAVSLATAGVPRRRSDSCSEEYGGRVGRGWGGWGHGKGKGSRYGGRRNWDLGRNSGESHGHNKRGSWERVDMPRWKKYSTLKPTKTAYNHVSPDGHVKSWGSGHSSGKLLEG
jgi:hypothetical protein